MVSTGVNVRNMNEANEQAACVGSRLSNGHVPDLLTEEELIEFLRIPEVSSSKDYHNVVSNLIRMRDLPRLHLGKKLLFPRKAILEWVEKNTIR